MTDLERARAHLQDCQEWLADVRAAPFVLAQGLYLGKAENAVLAALSWVWEEQCKAEFCRPGRVFGEGWQYEQEI